MKFDDKLIGLQIGVYRYSSRNKNCRNQSSNIGIIRKFEISTKEENL